MKKKYQRKYDPFKDVNRVKWRRKPPVEIGGVLQSVLKKSGLERDFARYKFVNQWEEIVGPQIAANTKPEAFRNDALIVRVVSSAWAQELHFQKAILLKRLQRHVDDGTVIKDIHFYVAGSAEFRKKPYQPYKKRS